MLFIILGPWLVSMMLLLVPITIANVAALLAVRVVGAAFGPATFHIAVGVVAGPLMIAIIKFVAENTREIGGGPLEPQTVMALTLGAVLNAIAILLVGYLGVKQAGR
jgi:hypothetical protein